MAFDMEMMEHFDRRLLEQEGRIGERLNRQDNQRADEFKTVNDGIKTLHGRITDLERQQTAALNEGQRATLAVVDSRLKGHKEELSNTIWDVMDLAQETKDRLIEHRASPCPGENSHPPARMNGNGTTHHAKPVNWKTWAWVIFGICSSAGGAVVVLRILAAISHLGST